MFLSDSLRNNILMVLSIIEEISGNVIQSLAYGMENVLVLRNARHPLTVSLMFAPGPLKVNLFSEEKTVFIPLRTQ